MRAHLLDTMPQKGLGGANLRQQDFLGETEPIFTQESVKVETIKYTKIPTLPLPLPPLSSTKEEEEEEEEERQEYKKKKKSYVDWK